MKTVVTGGAGFIGSHLVKRLLDEGREVTVADDFSRGSVLNLHDLGVETEIRKADLRDYSQAAEALSGADVVFHLAASVGSVEYLHRDEMAELRALQSNLAIDTNVFRICLEKKVRKIVYASSVSVYPIDLQQKPGAVFSEESLQYFNPEGGYGWAKLLGEIQLGWMKNISRGMARIFNVYGPCTTLGETAQVVPALMSKALMYPKKDFIIWGNGTQSRCFLYVSDCVDALVKLEAKVSDKPVVVNVGSDQTIPVSMLAEKIVKISEKNIDIEYDPSKPVGPISRTANINKAGLLLEWQPKTSLDEGLRSTYDWVEKRLTRTQSFL